MAFTPCQLELPAVYSSNQTPQNEACPTPPQAFRSSCPSSPHIPLAIRSLNRQANSLEEVPANLSPNIHRRLKTFIHDSLVQAQLGAQALENLAHTQPDQTARTARQPGGRHTIQGRGHGGALYAHEAGSMVMGRGRAD